ncbi:MAG: TRAP transporter small permease [Geminicoccaceae bacterium]
MSGIEQAAVWFGRLNDRLSAVCRYAVMFIVATLAIILASAVFWRYALNNAIPWSEEAAKYLMVWLTFLGAPVALRHGGHVNVDLVVNALSGRPRQFLLLAVNLVIIAVCLMLIWQGGLFAKLGARQVASSFQLSMVWVYGIVPLGGVLLLFVAIEHALRALVGIGDPDKGLKDTHEGLAEEVRE